MAEIKDVAAIQEKWARVTPQRTDDYKIGVSSPRRDWQKEAVAAKETHKAAMAAAAAADAYAKGVAKAGTSRWQQRALAKGPARFAEGVLVGASDYGQGFAPYQQVIKATALPARFPRGDPRNIQRVATIAAALRKAKTG
jgi:hypothetical protein